MNRYRTPWSRPADVARILAITVGIALLHLLVVVTVGASGTPYAFLVPLVVLLGPVAVWGVPLGAAIAELSLGGVSVYPLVTFLALFASAILARELWIAVPERFRSRRGHGAVVIMPIAIVATLVGIGLALVGGTILGTLGVAARFPVVLIERLLPAIILAPLIWIAGAPWRTMEPACRNSSVLRWTGLVAIVGLVGLGWVLGTVVFDLVRRDVLAFPHLGEAIAGVLPGVLSTGAAFALGPDGWIVYILGLLLAAAMLLVVFYRWLPRAERSKAERAVKP